MDAHVRDLSKAQLLLTASLETVEAIITAEAIDKEDALKRAIFSSLGAADVLSMVLKGQKSPG
jgi:hypothetical protein